MSFQETSPRAEGIRYFASPRAPSLQLFRCFAFRCDMTPSACARSWNRVQKSRFGLADDRAPCRACPIGAAHAGRSSAVYSRTAQFPTLCLRCAHGGHLKLIGGRLCSSCHARGAEFLRGRNAKGTYPRLAVPVRPMFVRFSINGAEPEVWSVTQADSPVELMLDLLRRHQGNLVFLPAEGESFPEVLPQRGPVIFKRIPLDPMIAGESFGWVGVDDPDWQAPTCRKPTRTRPRVVQPLAPKVSAWNAAWEVAKAAIAEIEGAGEMTMAQLARELEARGIPTARGGPWSQGKVERAMKGARVRPTPMKPVERQMVIRPVVKLVDQEVLAARAEASMYSALLDALRAA
jgi:hypothetical protein